MKVGLMLLAIWLILTGVTAFVRIDIPERAAVMGGLAVLAGIFLLIKR